MSGGRELALATLAGVVLAALLAIRIGAPWTFVHDDNGAWTQAVAVAHVRAGLAQTRGQDFMLRRADHVLVPYLHHPPLYPLTVAAVYAATGRSDPLVTRLIPAAFHLLGFVGFCLLARRVFPASPGRRALATFTYALVPMSSFFGKMPFNESEGLCWVIWGTLFLAAWRGSGGRPPEDARDPTLAAAPAAGGGLLAASCVFWALAGLTSWPAYAVLLGLWLLVVLEARRGGSMRAPLALGATALATLAVVVAHLVWAGGLDRLLGAGGYWGAGMHGGGLLLQSLGRALTFQRLYFANIPSLLLLLWVALAIRAAVRGGGVIAGLAPADRLLLAGAAGCALWALVFVRQVGVHGYGQFWLLPFESLIAADMAVRVWRQLAGRPILRKALAGTAAAVLLGSCAVTLTHRYTRPLAYAVETAAWLTETFETRP